MLNRESKTYKLCLSEAGVAKSVRALAPYGATLFVALAVADTLTPAKLAHELAAPTAAALHVRTVRFVGFIGHLADLTDRLCEKLTASGRIAAPPINRLYVAGLSCFASADDRAISRAYHHMTAIRSQAMA